MSSFQSTFTKEALAFVLSLAVSFAAAALGSLATIPNLVPWYASLEKPAWTPPNALFGPVWTILYTLMAVSAWLVWKRGRHAGASLRTPLALFLIQLALNALWSWLFFGWHGIHVAFLEVLVLWLAILATILSFRRVSPLAALLLLPYLLWVSYASALNGAIAGLN